jgi:hypothetical protein
MDLIYHLSLSRQIDLFFSKIRCLNFKVFVPEEKKNGEALESFMGI